VCVYRTKWGLTYLSLNHYCRVRLWWSLLLGLCTMSMQSDCRRRALQVSYVGLLCSFVYNG